MDPRHRELAEIALRARPAGWQDPGPPPSQSAAPRAAPSINDSWIAACCLVDQLPLATFNGKDYTDFAEHDGLRLFDVS